MNIAASLLDPVVSAAFVIVWGAAALLARAAQHDRPTGPAPSAESRTARRALALCGIGLLVAAAQLIAVVLHAVAGGPPLEPASWTAHAATLTGAALVALRSVGPLRRMAGGHPLTDGLQFRGMHAALAAATVSGGLAALVAVVSAGLVPSSTAGGPYLAPVLAVAAVVLGSNAVLRRGGSLVTA